MPVQDSLGAGKTFLWQDQWGLFEGDRSFQGEQ